MEPRITSEIVKEYGFSAGASVVGIAASKEFGLAPDGFKPTDVLPECLSVIVLGATFSPEVLNDMAEYTATRNTMLTEMTAIGKSVAKRIKADGWKTKAISASGGKTIEGKLYGYISLKHAAEIAGLGVIGKNYLLTNPQYGNLLWFSAVLTDAELIPDVKCQFTMCNSCNKCVEACPVGALDDLSSFGKKECSKFFAIENKKLIIKCFLCRTVCPHCFRIKQTV
ncbi:MAG: 4Fe-4S binding protein [Oscillospiraceae bacterium]|nr:4Fe-4S binding protein [Oscillospiraceae bacterium]